MKKNGAGPFEQWTIEEISEIPFRGKKERILQQGGREYPWGFDRLVGRI